MLPLKKQKHLWANNYLKGIIWISIEKNIMNSSSSRSYDILHCVFPSIFPWGINYYFTFCLETCLPQFCLLLDRIVESTCATVTSREWDDQAFCLAVANLYQFFDSPARRYGVFTWSTNSFRCDVEQVLLLFSFFVFKQVSYFQNYLENKHIRLVIIMF